ncbi:MAG: PAS domain S-box protein [Fimbriimonadales bacterium]
MKEFTEEALGSVLADLTDRIAQAVVLDDVFAAALEALSRVLPCERASVLAFDAQDVMRFRAWKGITAEYRSAVEGHTPWRPEDEFARAFVVKDVRLEPDLKEILPVLEREEILSAAFVPLVAGRRVIGKFMIYFREPTELSQNQLSAASVIASQVAFSIQRIAAELQASYRFAQLRSLFDATDHGLVLLDTSARIVHLNSASEELCQYLYGKEPVPGDSIFDVVGATEREVVEARFKTALRGERVIVDTGAAPDVKYGRRFLTTYSPVFDESAQVIGVTVSAVEVTDLLSAQHEVRSTQTRLHEIAEATQDALYDWDIAKNASWSNEIYQRAYGQSRDFDSWKEKVHPDDVARVLEESRRTFASGATEFRAEYRLRRTDGSYADVLDRARVIRDSKGSPVRTVGAITDLSELKQMQLESRVNERRFRALFENLVTGAVIWDRDEKVVVANRAFQQMLGYTEDELRELKLSDIVHPDEYPHSLRTFSSAMARDETTPILSERRLVAKDGRTVYARLSATIYRDSESGEPVSVAVYEDMTESVHRRIALGETQARYETLVKNLSDVIVYETDPSNLFVSENIATVLNVEPQVFSQQHRLVAELMGPTEWTVRSKDVENWLQHTSEPSFSMQYMITRTDGSRVWIEDRMTRAVSATGDLFIRGIAVDITDRKNLERELALSQRLDAVGRLAGGVAHDFNNFLAAIVGYSEIALSKSRRGESPDSEVMKVLSAANRANGLTKQLLAFARRQITAPVPTSLHSVVADLSDILERLLGESVSLKIAWEDKTDSNWIVNIDPVQVEQLIMNLAINARDAMPTGGTFRVEFSNVTQSKSTSGRRGLSPGTYVRISVSDTGCGMDTYCLEHAFEPFFSTKEVGKGTGLGLAVCYGIVQQAAGKIFVQSSPGEGTQFDIYLPTAQPGKAPTPKRMVRPLQKADRTTVLVVEDEASLREIIVHELRGLGHEVLQAMDGVEALEVAAEYPGEIGLVVTDVVMPRMSGLELRRRLSKSRPESRFLMVSGQYESPPSPVSEIPAEAFLQKPFTAGDLEAAIKAATVPD